MALQVEIDPDITVVRVLGNMTFEEADALTSSIRAVLDQGAKKSSWI